MGIVYVKVPIEVDGEICSTDCVGYGEDEGTCRLFPSPHGNNSCSLESVADRDGWYRCRKCLANEMKE